MNEFAFEHTIIDMFRDMKRSIEARPLNLGGIIGSGGGGGGPPGGYVGYLPQTKVSYDLSELATMDIPASGASLLDNLNRIRGRIQTLEDNPSGGGVTSDILLYSNGVLTEYLPTASGLAQAFTDAPTNSVVIYPPRTTISGVFTMPAGITLRGYDWTSKIAGTLVLSKNETGYSTIIDTMSFYVADQDFCLDLAVADVWQDYSDYVRNCQFITTASKYCVDTTYTTEDWTDYFFDNCSFETLSNPSYVFKKGTDAFCQPSIRDSYKHGTTSFAWTEQSTGMAYDSSHRPSAIYLVDVSGTYGVRTIIPSTFATTTYHFYSTRDTTRVFSVNRDGQTAAREFAVYSGTSTIIAGKTGIINNVDNITVSGMDLTIFNQNPTISGGIIINMGTETNSPLSLGLKIYEDGVLESGEIQELDFVNSKITVVDKKAEVEVRPILQAVFTVVGELAVGASKLRIYNATGVEKEIIKVFLSVDTAPVGSAITADIHKDGTTLFTTQSNRPQIADGNNTGYSTTIENNTWADGSYLTAEIDQVGSSTAGSDLTVHVVYN